MASKDCEREVAARRPLGGGDDADLEKAVLGEAGEDGVDGTLGDGEFLDFMELLDDLVAVVVSAGEEVQDAEFEESLAELCDPGVRIRSCVIRTTEYIVA